MIGIGFSTVSAQGEIALPTLQRAIGLVSARPRGPYFAPPIDTAASYSRYSSDLQDASSIEQQQRICREKAAANGHTILPEFEFADEAVSGTKRERDGLNKLIEAARAGKFGTLYFQCLSRLAREFVITLPMLKDLVHRCGIRIISVSEGIDSADPNWELTAMIRAWMHQEYLKVLRAAVLRGQQGAVLNEFSVGDWCFGYGSEPIPGSESGRTGRNPKPRMRYIINPEHARWVHQIFQWFVHENWPIRHIHRELSRLEVPKDHRSKTPGWEHQYVVALLRNTKYVGIWPWGLKTNERDPFTGMISQIDRPAEDTAKYLRHRPDLRLIDDETFAAAQGKLDANEAKYAGTRQSDGTLRGSKAGEARPRHLLQGITRCGVCGKPFHVNGAFGRYMVCAGYKRGTCSNKTRLPRQLAEQMILQVVQDALHADVAWKQAILEMAQAAWKHDQREQPNEQDADAKALRTIEQRIQNLLDELEVSKDPDVRRRLGERQRERDTIAGRLEDRKRRAATPKEPPTAEWVESELQALRQILVDEPSGAAEALHDLIGDVTVTPVELPGKKRLALRGTFRMSVRRLAVRLSVPPSADASDADGEAKVLMFAALPPWAALADRVKAAFDQGRLMDDIAANEKCPEPWVAKALAWWYQSRGLPVPDGRKCRARLDRDTLAESLADAAKALYDQQLHLQDIADKLSCHRDTITAAIAHWFRSRGLPVPDGRNRRKTHRGLTPFESLERDREGSDDVA